jgi:hypothetical protein
MVGELDKDANKLISVFRYELPFLSSGDGGGGGGGVKR